MVFVKAWIYVLIFVLESSFILNGCLVMPKFVAMRLGTVIPRVSALAGCDRLGIRATGYGEHRFFP